MEAGVIKFGSDNLVSVVIPAYNGQEVIPRAIDSVLQQTYANREIIVVDDGSTDTTLDVLSRYGPQITVMSQQNAGAAAARNTGVKHATGAYIAFLDQDDWWIPEKLEAQVRALENDPSLGLVFGNLEAVDNQGKSRTFMTIVPEHRHSPSLDELLLMFPLYPSSATLRKNLFDRIRGFDTRFDSSGAYGDQDLHIRLRRLAPFRFLDLKVGYYLWDELRPGRLHNFLLNLPIFAEKYWDSPLLLDQGRRLVRERFVRKCTDHMAHLLRRLLQQNGNTANRSLLLKANMCHIQLRRVFGTSYLTMGGTNSLNLESVNVDEHDLEVPLCTLLFLYLCRRDLQRKFPEVFRGNVLGLADWAFRVVRGFHWDIDYKTLAPFREYYEAMAHQVPLIATRAHQNPNSYLLYKITKSIDRFCPDGTLRGRLRMIITISLQTITEEGFRSFLAKAKRTLKYREFPVQ